MPDEATPPDIRPPVWEGHRVVYYVEGSTGEYSDRTDWPVAAYLDEAKAKEHVEKASARARELAGQDRDPGVEPDWERQQAAQGANEWDPNMQMDYTGTNYYVYTVPVLDWDGDG